MKKQAFAGWLRQLGNLSPSQWQQRHTHLELAKSTMIGDSPTADFILEKLDATHVVTHSSP